MVGSPLDSTPAEIAVGVFLPYTRVSAKFQFNGFEVTCILKIEERQPRCESLAIARVPGGPDVTATSLREIPLGSIIEQVLVGLGSPFRLDGSKRVPVATQTIVDERAARQPRSVLLPQIVEAYREALANPATRAAPTQAVADSKNYARGYVSRLLSDARKEGLLGPAKPGVPGEQER